jgi:hypothetical protein
VFVCLRWPACPSPRRDCGSALIAHTGDAHLALFDDGLREGQKVCIMSGPFADFVGTLKRLDDNERVRVLLEMMSTAVPVAIGRSGLLPADKACLAP